MLLSRRIQRGLQDEAVGDVSFLPKVLSCLQPLFASLPVFGLYLVERRGREEPLHPHRQIQLSTLLHCIPDAAIVLNLEGCVIDANEAAACLLGRPREQILGLKGEQILESLAPDRGTNSARPIFRRALKGIQVRHERRSWRDPATGQGLEMLVSASAICEDNGEIVGVLVTASDVTELTDLQRRIGDLEKHHALGQMTAALSHDFNNVLDSIGQGAALLEMDLPDPERREILKLIQGGVRRGSEIVSRLRDYLRSGGSDSTQVNVRQVLEEALELTRPLWHFSGVEVQRDLRPVNNISGNAADLRRVFTNMIINALEAMPGGGSLMVRCEQRGSNVVAEMIDTGEGISPEQQKKIFYPYFTTKAQGTGLGLSGALKIVRSQGGNINVYSNVGKGTTFTLTWPAAESSQHNSAA